MMMFVVSGVFFSFFAGMNAGLCADMSDMTTECITCHEFTHPGIVNSWKQSRHAQTSPAEALKKAALERRVSSTAIPEALQNRSVGCYECHSLRTDQHKDAFEHNGYTIQIVVSPDDCATCHQEERRQFQDNLMSFAHTNLANNTLYRDLITHINGTSAYSEGALTVTPPDRKTNAESCYYCHGTVVGVNETVTRETDFGEMAFPGLAGWPNQGVGRMNPDGSKGCCTSCHARHRFSIAMARKPATCSECHIGPDVPAYKVYQASKHGNVYNSHGDEWDFTAVPWKIGKDFSAPTCATCHASLLVDATGDMVVERSHGLPLPTELSGEPVRAFLIDEKTQSERTAKMQRACRSCHSSQWIDGHWSRLEHTIDTTNTLTSTGTAIMAAIWEKGYAQGLPQKQSIFDESVERTWSSLWLYYANTVRFASAMAGGGDYGVFANGRYFLSRVIMDLHDWLDTRKRIEGDNEKKGQPQGTER